MELKEDVKLARDIPSRAYRTSVSGLEDESAMTALLDFARRAAEELVAIYKGEGANPDTDPIIREARAAGLLEE